MYDEFKYYRFGLKLGISNLLRNGLALGVKKTLGKIAQPINSYTRFPEYFFVENAMRERLGRPCRVLDIGSPKLFGFYLAAHYPVELYLTDISPDDVAEYEIFWRAVRCARGKVTFGVQDARHLSYDDDYFDVVYSMSVVEHIEGPEGDREAMREMTRVLKPGGQIVVSVPCGSHYTEQYRAGSKLAAKTTAGANRYFFQRIYDPSILSERLVNGSDPHLLVTISRQHSGLTRRYSALSENARGFLGVLAPVVSRAVNRHSSGVASEHGGYGRLFAPHDIYGDVIFAAHKPSRSCDFTQTDRKSEAVS